MAAYEGERRRRRRPAAPDAQGVSTEPAVPKEPAVNKEPAVPKEPVMPTVPTVPALPALPALPAADPAAQATVRSSRPQRRRRGPRPDSGEALLRDIVGSGSSQLGVGGALRGRDVARPTDADLAEALADVQIVRRNWVPAADTPPPPPTSR